MFVLFTVEGIVFDIITQLVLFEVDIIFFTAISGVVRNIAGQAAWQLVLSFGQQFWSAAGNHGQAGLYSFQMWDQAVRVARTLMQAEANHKLPFCTGLNVIRRFGQRFFDFLA